MFKFFCVFNWHEQDIELVSTLSNEKEVQQSPMQIDCQEITHVKNSSPKKVKLVKTENKLFTVVISNVVGLFLD